MIETDRTMDQITKGLTSKSTGLKLAAVSCLHSLSRSVQQLRTSFQDHAVWKPLMMVSYYFFLVNMKFSPLGLIVSSTFAAPEVSWLSYQQSSEYDVEV